MVARRSSAFGIATSIRGVAVVVTSDTSRRRDTRAGRRAIPEPPRPMAADARAVFEVATIKPSMPDRPGKLFTVRGRQVLTVNASGTDLVVFAYDLHAHQVTGGPSWMETEKFDVTGQPEAPGIPAIPQLRAMIRQLLADRFTLTFHRESRELPVYALVVASGGPKLAPNHSNPNGLPSLLFKGLGVLPAVNATMGDLAGSIPRTPAKT